MRAPAAVPAEIAWRWAFGIAFWVLVVLSFREYFAHVEISQTEYQLMRGLEPFTWIAVSVRVMQAFVAGLRVMGPILVPGLVVLWVGLASVGRAATVRGLVKRCTRTNWRGMIALNLARVVLAFAALAAFFGAGFLANRVVGDVTQAFVAAIFLNFISLLLIGCAWGAVNWFLSIAVIFPAYDGSGFSESISRAGDLYHKNSGSFVGLGVWFGLLRALLIVVVTAVSLSPLQMIAISGWKIVAAVMMVVSIGYFAVADAVNVWRLAAYIGLTEEEGPEVATVPVVQPAPEYRP